MLARSFPANITITCSADAGGWPALADPAQLENALVNLALNARDAMPEGGRLRFAVSYESPAEGDYVRIRVIDSGTGIAPEVQARMLEPFFTTKPFGSGSGLGLPMVFGFARQSGGDLRIDSELGQGTSVSLLLPRAPADAPRAVDSAEPTPAIANHGELVLLVEDHDDVREAVRRQLLELGYQVLEARDGDDARSLLAAVPGVSILVSDVVMPGGQDGGLGLIDHARQQLPGLRTLLISGFASFSAAGYEWFDEKLVLHKPFDREQLARALERAKP
jgi:CheY-like chemotaxis protein/anti-sigma regulatory factor (Ser/Thr protein kinase)